jgi:branched-chain amino acid transport system permease protein
MSTLLNIFVVGVLLGGIYGLVSIGLNLIFGVIRIVNFAQGEFVMLGMYGAYLSYLLLGTDPYVSILLVVPALFLFGVVVQRFILQPLQNEPMMQVFATFGLLLLLQNLVLAITRGMSLTVPSDLSQVVFDVGGVSLSLARLLALVAVTAVAAGLQWFLHSTLPGKAVRAVTQDRRSARLMGVNFELTYMLTFGKIGRAHV